MSADSPHNAPSATIAPDGSTGGHVGPYRLVRRVGTGGTGSVWLADDERLERAVALKLLDERWSAISADPSGARARFLSEARTAARLDHPNIATVFDVGETPDGRLYLAMAYCEGGSLADRLQRAALPVREALLVTRQLASALGAVHD